MPNRPDDLVVSVEPRNDGGATLSGRAGGLCPEPVPVSAVPALIACADAILPCPFCGGEASVIGIRDGRQVSCKGQPRAYCFAKGPAVYHGPGGWDACEAEAIAAWNARHQSGRTGAGERETVARVIHQCLRPVNMMNADWDSGAILGANNSWRRSVYSTADHILAALGQPVEAGEDGHD